jgi:hypothetical protein
MTARTVSRICLAAIDRYFGPVATARFIVICQSIKSRRFSSHPGNRALFSVPGKFHKGSQGKKTSPVAEVFLAVKPTSLSRIVLAFNRHVGFVGDLEPRCRASQLGQLITALWKKKQQAKKISNRTKFFSVNSAVPFAPAESGTPTLRQDLRPLYRIFAELNLTRRYLNSVRRTLPSACRRHASARFTRR